MGLNRRREGYPVLSSVLPAPVRPARESLHVQVDPRPELGEPEIPQSPKRPEGPCAARGEADGLGGLLTRPGTRPARGGAPARSLQDPETVRLLGSRLKGELARLGISQSRAARVLGVSRMAVAFWCQGRALPTVVHLHRAVLVLGLDPRALFPEWFR